MTLEELKEAIEAAKKEGYTEEELLGIFYVMYGDGAITLDELRTMTEVMGYEFTEEFEAMPEEEKKRRGLTPTDDAEEGVDKEDVEDAKEFKKGELPDWLTPIGERIEDDDDSEWEKIKREIEEERNKSKTK